jgi:NADH-quinone oxidoreductase subunit H
MITAAFLMVILFFGGWHLWGMPAGEAVNSPVTWLVATLRVAILLAKVLGVVLFFMLVRWSWPRFRFDQLMNIAWKVMLPWGLVNLVIVAFSVEYGDLIARSLGVPAWLPLGACGWGALLLSWLVVTLIDPTKADNRPLRTVVPRRLGD